MYAPGLIRGRVWPATLMSADFFYWPGEPYDWFAERSSPTTRAVQGGAVGIIPNRGRLASTLVAQTADANRGTLEWAKANLLRGHSSVRYAQTFSAQTPSAIYTIAAFKTPSSASNFERLASIAQNATSNDNAAATTGACLLLRNGTGTGWGVFRTGLLRGTVTLANSTKGVIETICESTQTTISLNGGTDVVTGHAAIGSFNVSSFRALCAHETAGGYGSSTASDLYALAVFLSLPSADTRRRARAEAAAIMRSLT
jgi:hypothetical protein